MQAAPGAKRLDSTPITPADLVYTYEVATSPALPIRSDVRAAYREVLPGALVIDGSALTFTMDAGAHVEQLFTIILPKSDVLGTGFLATGTTGCGWPAADRRRHHYGGGDYQRWRPR